MNPFRIVQISDLHILPERGQTLAGVDTSLSLVKVLDDIKKLSPPVELIIASGDLSDDGSEQSYQRLRDVLNTLPCPIFVLAGNHDETQTMQEHLLDGKIFFDRQKSLGDWQLLFVKSKLEGASYGFIDDDEMCWLEARLSETSQPVLLVMHHTPLRLCASPTCQMKNADQLLRLIRQFKQVKGLIAGHTHNHAEEVRGELRIMTTPSTMVQVTHNKVEALKVGEDFWTHHQADTSRYGYRLLDLQADGVLASEIRYVGA